MKKTFIIFAAIALAICSCGRNKNNQNSKDTVVSETNSNDNSIQTECVEEPIEQQASEFLFGIGDLNQDGIMDSVVIAKEEVYRDNNEGVTPTKGEGLKIYFGNKQGTFDLLCSHNEIETHYFAEHAEWKAVTIDKEGNLSIIDQFEAYYDYKYTYVLKYRDNDFYLIDFTAEQGLYDYQTNHYDLVNKTLESESGTYSLKDLPLKKLSEIKIGEEVCDFYDYVAIFKEAGESKEELCSDEFVPEYSEGDLNGDDIDDLVISVKDKTFAIYFKDPEGTYHCQFQGNSCDKDTETSAYFKDGYLMVYAFTESSKEYKFQYDDGNFYLISFEQSMYWPDDGGSYYQFIDFVDGKRTEQEDDNPETTVDIPQKPLRVIEEFHFGNMYEIEQLIEDIDQLIED